jgi:hypothetical protein
MQKLVVQDCDEKNIASSVKSGETADVFGICDTGSDLENGSVESYETVVPKLSKVIGNVNEVKTW